MIVGQYPLHDSSEQVENNTADLEALREVTKSIAQHGGDVDDIKLAFSLGTIATVLAPEKKKHR